VLVKHWMKRNVITVEPEMSIKDAFLLLRKYRIRQLPVVKDGVLVGIVAEKDFGKTSLEHPEPSLEEVYRLKGKLSVGDIMTMEVITVSEDTPVEEAAALLLRHRINGLPVISKDGKLCGIITTSDILGAFVTLSRHEKG
jgi:acetoin utilization protein AcuB